MRVARLQDGNDKAYKCNVLSILLRYCAAALNLNRTQSTRINENQTN